MTSAWKKITFVPLDPNTLDTMRDTLACELVECGAAGTTLESDNRLLCFAEESPSLLEHLQEVAHSYGFTVAATEDVPQENWNQRCPEVWEPFTRGRLTVVPVESVDDTTPLPDNHIKIIPGLGFGTGHHPTTNMILGVLSTFADEGLRPSAIFDLGTGSGILAIAAARLFKRTVIANDIDPHAIENARENAELNHVSDLIDLSTTPTELLNGSFDLILANVYGEVLTELSPHVTRLASRPSLLVLSGITELVRDQVEHVYTSEFGWQLVAELSEGGWVCLVLRR